MLAVYYRRHHRHSIGAMLRKLAMGTLMLALILGGAVWVSRQFFAAQQVVPTKRDATSQEKLPFEYTVTAEIGHIRVNGTASFPNGVSLVGTLDKVGSGQIDLKEALVMNHLFTMEFGPELYVQYYLHGLQDALQAGRYRLTVEFDPARQSPFAQGSLSPSPPVKDSLILRDGSREENAVTMRVSKSFTMGTTAEQQEAQIREQQEQQTIQQHLRDTLASLTNVLEHLYTHFQDERSKGNFSRADVRAGDWQTWSSQWLNELEDYAEKARLDEMVSPASPYYPAWQALGTIRKQLKALPDLYFEVVTNDRSLTDPELQRTEQLAQNALGDAIAQLGRPDKMPFPATVASVKPSIVVLSPVANVRSGPGMHYESIRQVKKDDVLTWLGERGEWFQVQLGGGGTGWVHRTVVSKRPQGAGTSADAKPLSLEQGSYPQLEPISLASTPVEFIPSPTSDEVKIYEDVEQQLRGLQAVNAEDRRAVEQRILQRMSDKHGISPDQVWNTYLKVQGWQIRP
jgi:uncharacterized protein YgiM (DUF1202 family)